jgi:hypothetical protein
MEMELKKAVFHTKAAILIIIRVNRAALEAVFTALADFIEKIVDVQNIFKKVYVLRSLTMFNKTFTIIAGFLVLAFAAYIIAQDLPYQDRPVQERQLQRDPQLGERPLAGRGMLGAPSEGLAVRPPRPVQSLSVWFEAVKQAYDNSNEQRLNQLIRRMDNLLAQRDEAARGRPLVQTFERWFTEFKNAHQMGEWQRMGNLIKRYEQASGQIRGRIQERFGQTGPQRPVQPGGPMTGYGRGWRGGQGQPTQPQIQGQPGAGFGRGFRGGRGQIILPPAQRGWGWRIDIRPLPPPRRFQQEQGFQREPLQPQMRGGRGPGMGRGMGPARGGSGLQQGPALRGQLPESAAPIQPQRRGMPRRGLIPEENVAPVEPQQFDWN